MLAAKNRGIDVRRRRKTEDRLAPELISMIGGGDGRRNASTRCLAHTKCKTNQLRMMYSCCQLNVPKASRTALVLKTLCGFSVRKIAQSLLLTELGVQKRIERAKSQLRESEGWQIASGKDELTRRTGAVHDVLYLLFNEGYHSSHDTLTVREDLCAEAIRLAFLLTEYEATRTPASHALLALMCLHAARLKARMDTGSSVVLLAEQDRQLFDRRIIAQGMLPLALAAEGDEPSSYHQEAAIAVEHCTAPSFEQTNWERIVTLYEHLYGLDPSPVVRLSYAIALGEWRGPESALDVLVKLEESPQLANYPFFSIAYGEWLRRAGDKLQARSQFDRAKQLARNESAIRFIETRLALCN